MNFEIYAGDARDIVINVTDSAGNPVDIRSAGIYWAASKHRSSADVAIRKTLGTGISITGTNQFTVTLTESDTKNLEGTYYHQARIVLGGKKYTVLEGVMVVKPAFA